MVVLLIKPDSKRKKKFNNKFFNKNNDVTNHYGKKISHLQMYTQY